MFGNIARRPSGKYRARFRDADGREHARHFDRRVDAEQWLRGQSAALLTGSFVDPKRAEQTVRQWCDTWLDGYRTRRPSTVRQAEVHVAQIIVALGAKRLGNLRPSDVKAWTARLRADGLSPSYVYALHGRLSQILSDAVLDGVLARNPCSRRTSPGAGKQRAYVATTQQVWQLHDEFPEHLRPAVLLGAFAGLRTAEACGLRVDDVDFMRGVVRPAVQWPGEELKTETSRTAVPIPSELSLELSAAVARWGGQTLVTDGRGGSVAPWTIERAVRAARPAVDGLPEAFRFHDLRHFLASLLIASGLDVKVVQARLRHASAKTTLDTYGHLWPDADESARAAVGAVFAARADSLRTRGEVIS